ncbi:AraC family transcriptional regulator [Enterococcus casseliflavus]|uniref:AraC family transcriptional regulator n=1 Tax=Enterococcus casseliflavus TaxID=37734 RepID=UPI001883DBF8|nr:AraC family transcriptional regulator [Enterococcus casseliflavus]MBE9909311.1 AraC family transcriptional regulator [Enterococcus casseliflavus]
MDFSAVTKRLFNLTEREVYYKEKKILSKDYYQKLETKNLNGQEVYVFDDLIPVEKNYNVVKHSRFIKVPLHIHNFIELNYIYSGSCTQFIDNKKVTLTEGQICLIDTSVPHSIEYTDEKDIIINILVKKEYFIKQISHGNFDSSIVFEFILNALSETQSHNQYIVFKNNKYDQLRLIVDQILNEHFEGRIGSDKIIENLISILFSFLVRNFEYDTNKKNRNKHQIVKLLEYIDNNFMDITLSDAAEKFNYTPSYISTLLKIQTGKNFSQLILEKKLNFAEILLQNTDKSIQQCADESGFTNSTYFYEKYKSHFRKLPSENRKMF